MEERIIKDINNLLTQLFQKMKEAGYTFDFEKKELKSIIDEEQIKKNLQDNSFRRMFEQKPAEWNEDDEKIYKSITYSFAHNYPLTVQQQEFVKSLKSRVQQKQEWTEEDSPYYDDICEILISLICSETSNVNKDVVQKDLDWLRAIKDRVLPQQKQYDGTEIASPIDSDVCG